MKNNQNKFKSGNIELFYQSWLPGDSVKAVVIIVHGGGDHSGRFSNVVDHFLPEGYGIYMFDLRGHGQSPGKRGHIHAWDEYRQDLAVFIDLVHNQFLNLPLILFGHSMGGAIVLDYCLRRQDHIDAVIVTSPAIGKLGISPLLFQLARILDKVWPSLVLPTGLVVPHLSRDTAFIHKTQSDPLYHSRSTPRFGMEMMKAIEFIQKNAQDFTLPLYLIHGTGDKIASIEGSRKFVSQLPPTNVTYTEYEAGYHELFNDLDKEKVLTQLLHWMNRVSE